MTSALELTVRAHWIGAWLLYPLGRPVVVVDGSEHAVRWRRPARIPAAVGKHSVAVGFRYRGTRWLLGAREKSFVVPDDVVLRLAAKNGMLNGEPFHIEIGAVLPLRS